ncbi:hypothetical protein ACFPM3_33110 [Streptomyces coeruleoprunus]|uniref:Secreted protein n=1 Tax=Streptomyces coeruleoprunus TaxID=285563 RepID=A0ABV9XNI4_9ACTN
MPRPTAAQLAYGSATVVCSTVALLLLFDPAGAGVALIGVVALLLGLLVTLAAPVRRARAAAASAAVSGPSARVPGPRARARTGEHSLRH